MAPESFDNFFLAMAGAGGALIGLLFVAVSINRELTFGHAAQPEQRYLAEGALVALLNGFVVSAVALVPRLDVGAVAALMSVIGLSAAANLAVRLVQLHLHRREGRWTWADVARGAIVSVLAFVLFADELRLGVLLLVRPSDLAAVRSLALVVVGIYVLALLRAWTLLGDPQHGISGWLNPLRDVHADPRRPDG